MSAEPFLALIVSISLPRGRTWSSIRRNAKKTKLRGAYADLGSSVRNNVQFSLVRYMFNGSYSIVMMYNCGACVTGVSISKNNFRPMTAAVPLV